MTLRKRIALILSGLVVFVLAGPVIIFIAQGYSFDFQTNRLVSSGTLVIKTEPRGAEVKIKGQAALKTPLTKRFVQPGDYFVEISKDDYFPWQKRFSILPSQVTFLPKQNASIALFRKSPSEIRNQQSINGIYSSANSIFYLSDSGHQIYRLGFGLENPVSVASTTTAFNGAEIINSRMQVDRIEFLLSSHGTLWFVSGAQAKPFPSLAHADFGHGRETVLGINARSNLVEVGSATSTVLAKDVLSFSKAGNDLYFISRLASGESVLYYQRSNNGAKTMTLIPEFNSAKIIVSPQNQIYVLLDTNLYEVNPVRELEVAPPLGKDGFSNEVNQNLTKIRSGVNDAYWDEAGDLLAYGNEHEFWIYNPLSSASNQLLVRSTTAIASPVYHQSTGYAFWIEGQEIKAIEVDGSGQPNVYTLLRVTDPKKIIVNDLGNTLAVLDGQTLHLFQIR